MNLDDTDLDGACSISIRDIAGAAHEARHVVKHTVIKSLTATHELVDPAAPACAPAFSTEITIGLSPGGGGGGL
jgi:hypothetical protein